MHRWTSGVVAVVVVIAGSALASEVVVAAEAESKALASYEGDNTIHLKWDARNRRVSEATSSRRLTADQKVELLTTLVDGKGRIVMRATLENLSKNDSYRIRGRLVHRVFRDGDVVKALRTRKFRIELGPGDKIVAKYSYGLRTGEYSTRTDYVTE